MITFESILDQVTDLQQQGLPKDEIVGRFPDFKDEIEELWEVLGELSLVKSQLMPSTDSLRRALAVTKPKRQRLISYIGGFMNKAKILMPLGAMAALLAVVLVTQGTQPVTDLASNLTKPSTMANGSVDTAFEAMVRDATDEESLIAGEDGDIDQAANDAVNDEIGDSIDENNL